MINGRNVDKAGLASTWYSYGYVRMSLSPGRSSVIQEMIMLCGPVADQSQPGTAITVRNTLCPYECRNVEIRRLTPRAG